MGEETIVKGDMVFWFVWQSRAAVRKDGRVTAVVGDTATVRVSTRDGSNGSARKVHVSDLKRVATQGSLFTEEVE